ncbi:hypothetical protein Y032_0177g601 [Ancylostoma ceylanicum]|uniref:Uncharacterized protein n=1 Tax=Ancylostoma ceylanicum TaxID=53326 RepID=A0A016SUA4_9BILA|nr:hypothetical protein Y032_0177g601 [Ancylostoma ceylanicum]
MRRAVLTAMNVGLLAICGVVWFAAIKAFLVKKKEIMEMLKHVFLPTKTETRPRIEIVHPIDSFSTPPSVTSEAVSTIKLKFTKFSTRGRKTGRILVEALRSNSPPSSATDEHLSVNELHSTRNSRTCFISPSVMDSLPDPPQLSVEKLPQLEKIFRMNENSTTNASSAVCFAFAPTRLSSDDLKPPEYLNLQPMARTRPSKAYPRIDTIFANETPTDPNPNMETTSFIEELDVTTLLTTETTSEPLQLSGTCKGSHRIVIEDECEFSTVTSEDTGLEIESGVRGTFRAVRADVHDKIPL